MKNTFFFLSVILLLASCGGSKKAKSSSTRLFLTGTKWTELKIQDVMSTGSMNSRTLELTLPDKKGTGTISGNGGCNLFNGGYTSEKGTKKIQFTNIAATKMMCGEDKQEQKFFNALNSVNSYELSGNILKLYSGGELSLTLEGVNIVK